MAVVAQYDQVVMVKIFILAGLIPHHWKGVVWVSLEWNTLVGPVVDFKTLARIANLAAVVGLVQGSTA